KWFKQVGDEIKEDEPLFEVSTDKVDSEVPSPAAGYLAEILVQEGDTVDVGTKLAVISSEAPSGDGGGKPSEEKDDAEETKEEKREAKREEAPAKAEPKAEPKPEPKAQPVAAAAGDEVVPFSNIRRRTAEHMVRSKATSAHTLTAIEVDYDRVERVRQAAKDE